ncbi:MATE family efflux transporter [Mycoplasmatota bacterium]|nr:MATE family efflux transporter [Mycoplasmatota bacterium]
MKKVYNVTQGPILEKLVLLAIPILLTTLSQMAYNLTDIFWIGRVDSIGLSETSAVAAVGTASYLTWFCFGVILIAKIGTSVRVSHAVGRDELHKVNVYASNGLLLQAFFGVLFSLLTLIFTKQYLAIFNIESQTILNYAMDYIPIIGGFIFVQFLVHGFVAINEGLGQTKINLWILAAGFIFNIILDPLFILVFKLGLSGAAIATVISQIITLIIFYIVYKKINPEVKVFHFKNFNLEAVKKILKIGIPVGTQSMFFTLIAIYIARQIYLFGEEVVAAQRIGVQIEQLTWMIASGFQTAITVFIGQNFGAKAYDRVRKSVYYAGLILIPYALMITGLLYFIPGSLMRIFLDEFATIQHGIVYLQIISMSQVFMIIEGIGTGFFNGIAKSYIPSIIGIVGNSLRIPLVLILTGELLERGIWWSLNISTIFKAIVIVLVFVYFFTRIENVKVKKLVLK